MDKFNLNVYMEQVNHEADESTVEKWEENAEQALSNVVDPNTEFKPAETDNSTEVTPSNSYGLNIEPKLLSQNKHTTEAQSLVQRKSNKELIQIHTDCLERELEESLEGYKSRRKRSVPDSSLLAKVHACTPSHLPTQKEVSIIEEMDPEANVDFDSHNKLHKYPQDRITVVTEKCSYLTRSPSKTKALETHHKHRIRERTQTGGTDSPMSYASSQESVSTASIPSAHFQRRDSVISNHSIGNTPSEVSCRLDRSMTTADQLAWEFRRVRDRLDSASNISGCSSRFEIDSTYSERGETMSTISDVSGYEEEMFRIKRLLLLDSSTPTPPPGKYGKISDHYITPPMVRPEVITTPKENVEIQMHRLTVQLQNALTEKEKYKMEAMVAENKIALEWQEKHQEILRQKAHLEGQLETIQSEMSALTGEKNELAERNRTLEQEVKMRSTGEGKNALQEMQRLVMEINTLHEKVQGVTNKNEDLAIQLELKDSEVKQCKHEVKAIEEANEKLRIELQELKVESESKDGSIQGLKAKISDQHIEFQSLLQAKLKAENNVTSLKNEIESMRKSGNWYRDQLHACQAAKVKVQQELMSSQANSVSQSHEIEKLKGEIASLQHLVEATQQGAIREKEALMRKLEVIQADMLERETTIFSQIHNESTTDTINTIASKLKKIEEEKKKMINMSDMAVQELKEEIISLKTQFQAKETALEAVSNENTQLMVQLTTLQKSFSDREMALQLLENKCRNTEMSHNYLAENLKAKEELLLDLKNEKVAVEVALAAAEREKSEVNSAIDKLREDFARITNSYQSMKNELREKGKYVVTLKNDISALKKEKENLLDKLANSRQVEDELKLLQGRMSRTESLEQQLEQASQAKMEISVKYNEMSEAHSYVKEQMKKMEETVAVREEQLVNQTKNFEVHSEELKVKEQAVAELQAEKASLEDIIKTLRADINTLEGKNKKSSNEIVSLKKQISRANDALEQFNLLCRKSEEEKNELSKKVKKFVEKEEEMQQMCNKLEEEKVEIEIRLKELLDNKNQAGKTEDPESPVMNGDIISAESIKSVASPPEIPANLLQLKPLFENGFVQTSFHSVFDLIQKAESKLMLFLSETLPEDQVSNEKIKGGSGAIKFESVLSMLLNMDNYLSKALKWKNQLLTEIKAEKETNQCLRNEISILKKKSGEVSESSSHERLNNISYSTQTETVSVDNTGTQTVNDDAVKYKQQVEFYLKEIGRLKKCVRMSEIEQQEKHRKYETNIRTLLKKVKEHMRGRKLAEKALEEIRMKTEDNPDVVKLRTVIDNLNVQLEASQKKYEEQRKLAEKNQEAMLELEKERGKLAQTCSISQNRLPSIQVVQEDSSTVASEFDQKARELQMQQVQKRVSELEEQVHKLHIINKDLRKEIFTEKCETSQLRKQVASLQMGLDTANDMLDTKKVELGRAESLNCVLRTNISHIKKQLEDEQQNHEECKQDVERLRASLEETKAKDPVLADQIKTLSYHLHQKTQEAAGLLEKLRLSEERWSVTEIGLQRNLSALQEELAALHTELDSVRADKFTLQTQAAELRVALQSSVEQNKMLRLKLETFGCENKDKLPDLTLSLPLPPTKYDESRIAELLHQSTVLPHNKPLNNLQCCLDSLKQEMAVLQRQVAAKTLPKDTADGGDSKREQSNIKDV